MWREAVMRDLKKSRVRLFPLPLPAALMIQWGYLYVIRAGDMVKIGTATYVDKRLKELQTAHHEQLELMVMVPVHRSTEVMVHKCFAHLCVRGEWFKLTPEIVSFVEALRDGKNPLALVWSVFVSDHKAKKDPASHQKYRRYD